MAPAPLKCSRHQESTRLCCSQCQEPICPRCLVRTEVGLRCEDCAKPTVVTVATPAGRRSRRPLIAAALGALLMGAVIAVIYRGSSDTKAAPPASSGTWSDSGSSGSIRGTTTAVVLRTGEVLVAGGGVGAIALASAEVFDPASGRRRPVASLNQARRGHQAVVLADGRVLVAGGLAEGTPLATAEIYDPATDKWTLVEPMSSPRLGHSLTVLADGRVLAAGGSAPSGPIASAEIYDLKTGKWSPAATMTTTRFEHTATLLDDGRVLVAGGVGPAGNGEGPLASTEIFDPAAGSFIRSSELSEARTNHAAAVLADHSVIVVGGVGGADTTLASAEVFDPRQGRWSRVASMTQGRTGETVTTLAGGGVLAAGGESVDQGVRRSLASAELYDATSRSWRSAGNMLCPRSEAAAALLNDGRVLVVAGDFAAPGQAPMAQSCSETFQPATFQPAAIKAR